jgi:hypothetical protein
MEKNEEDRFGSFEEAAEQFLGEKVPSRSKTCEYTYRS